MAWKKPPRKKISREMENAYLADECISLIRELSAGKVEIAQARAARLSRELRIPTGHPDPRVLRMWQAAIASPNTPAHLKAALLIKLASVGVVLM